MPRRQITQSTNDSNGTSELPTLTAKQLAFVEAILRGRNASDAYRETYNAENMAQTTLWATASKLRSNRKVAAWIEYAKALAVEQSAYTVSDHVAELDRLAKRAEAAGNYGAATQCVQLKGRALGFYHERDVHETPQVLDLLATGLRLLGPIFQETELYVRLTRRAGQQSVNGPVIEQRIAQCDEPDACCADRVSAD